MSTLSIQPVSTHSHFATDAAISNPVADPVRRSTPPRGRRVRVLDLDLVDTTLEQAGDWIVEQAQNRTSTTIGFVNAHFANLVHDLPALRETVRQFDCFYADGIGVKIAARLDGIELAENVNGTDLFPVLCRKAAVAGVSLFLLGGQPGIASAAATTMQTRTPDLDVRGTSTGHFADREHEELVIESINASGANILLVGMGMPIQEQWIERNRHRLSPKVIIAVGGLFDFYSGRIQRAPKIFRKNGLEWAWRLAMEPRRLFKRYVIGNARFLTRLAARHVFNPARTRQLPASQ